MEGGLRRAEGAAHNPAQMSTSTWKPEYTAQALERWEEYQRQHDLSNQLGRVAAIDPVSGRVWIAESGVDVAALVRREEVDVPVYLVRIGYPSYIRKGRR